MSDVKCYVWNVNVKCKCNNEVVNSVLAEAEWVQNQDLWTPCMGATAPENCCPPKVLAYFAQCLRRGPDVQRNPALTARQDLVAGCDALSVSTTRTRRQPVALGWGLLLVLRELPTLAGLGDCRVSSCILTATYGMTRSRNCGLQKISGGGSCRFPGRVSPRKDAWLKRYDND